MKKGLFLFFIGIASSCSIHAQKVWTLSECVDYALKNNISLEKARANVASQDVSVYERRGALLPNVSAAVQQGLNWRPLTESTSNFVNNGITSASAKHTTYSGSYGVNASWTAWNGGRTQMNIESAKMNRDIAMLAVDQNANNICEQLVQFFIQILYMEEALKVNEQLLEHDRLIYQRGCDMVEQGQMSRSDLVQLESQVASGEYDVVNTRTQISQLKLSLKQLLELDPEDKIEIAAQEISDEKAMSIIPDCIDVFEYARVNRPEMRSAELSIEQSRLTTKMSKAQRLPTLSLNAGVSDSHMNGGQKVGVQFKNNFAGALSAGLQIPIFDGRQSKAAIQRAQVGELTARLDRQEIEKKLYQTIEQFWQNASNSQMKYRASTVKVKSMLTNYALLEDQFNLGLKNIVDLLQGRSNLLNAQQSNLQDKYTTVLNMLLLDFYNGEELSL